MQFKAFIFMGLLFPMANVQAQDLNKNNAVANLELIELLGGLDDSGDDLEALGDAMQTTETKSMTKKPTINAKDMTLKDKGHPVGGEK